MATLIINLKNGNQIIERYADRNSAQKALQVLTMEIQTGKHDVVLTPGGGSSFRIADFSSATIVDR